MALAILAGLTVTAESASSDTDLELTGSRAETLALIEDYQNIQLTPEQEEIRVEALEALPAPCCAKFSAATCCCECNMSRATWGLAKRLIVHRDFDAEQVRTTVAEWHKKINPKGFSGESCFQGGCSRPFVKDGCGGMKEDHLVF